MTRANHDADSRAIVKARLLFERARTTASIRYSDSLARPRAARFSLRWGDLYIRRPPQLSTTIMFRTVDTGKLHDACDGWPGRWLSRHSTRSFLRNRSPLWARPAARGRSEEHTSELQS